jgi:hypothetical protein
VFGTGIERCYGSRCTLRIRVDAWPRDRQAFRPRNSAFPSLVLIEGLPYKEAAQIIGIANGDADQPARARQVPQQLPGRGDSA